MLPVPSDPPTVSSDCALPTLCHSRYSDHTMWIAFLGLLDQSKRSASGVQEHKLKRIITHPSFNDFTFDYDIALLELEKPAEYSTVVRPICLPDATHVFPAGKAIWVTGWGHTKEGGELQTGQDLQRASGLPARLWCMHTAPFLCLARRSSWLQGWWVTRLPGAWQDGTVGGGKEKEAPSEKCRICMLGSWLKP